MPTIYTYFLVSWVADSKRSQAIEALDEAAQTSVASYSVGLQRLEDLSGLDLAPNVLVTEAWADWSVMRPEGLPAYLAVARQICGVGIYTVLNNVHTYIGDGGAWCAWPRAESPTLNSQRGLEWLEAQGWEQVIDDPKA